MHFQIFIPNVQGANPQHLVDVGLANLALGSHFQDGQPGPDDQRGVMVNWWGEGPKRNFTYDAASQKWAPGPEQAYWVGFVVDDPPRECELRRDYMNAGNRVSFNDEVNTDTWIIPRSESLDRALILQDDGSLRFEPLRRFGRFNAACESFRAKFLSGKSANFSWEELASFVTAALDLNYRMPVPLPAMLGLLTKQTMARAALAAACTESLYQQFESGELEFKVN